MGPSSLGKTLILAGLIITCVGIVILVAGRIPFLGKLPGDVHMERPGFSLHIPIVTCLLLSLIVTIIINFFLRK